MTQEATQTSRLKLGHIEIFVRDLAVATRFYVDVLGFTHNRPEVAHVAWIQLGDQEILLRPGEPVTGVEQYADARCGLVLYTVGLDETRSALEARGLRFSGTDGSERCLTFTDPEDFLWDPG